MAVISKGQTFATGDQVTASKLNNLADNATFASGAVDNVSTQLSGGAIIVKDGGVTTAKLNDGAVTTAKITDANVTTAKIADANVTFAKLTDVIDDDTMATATATTLATSESIKAYVDSAPNFTPNTYAGGESVTLPNGLIMKFGIIAIASRNQDSAESTVSFATPFPNSIIYGTSTILIESGAPDNHSFVDDLSVNGMRIVSGSTALGTYNFGWTWMAIGY